MDCPDCGENAKMVCALCPEYITYETAYILKEDWKNTGGKVVCNNCGMTETFKSDQPRTLEKLSDKYTKEEIG